MDKTMNPWQVGVAAEAIAASLFARCGLDVSVQYGANQPEYDLIVSKDDFLMKVSVKGSQDGGWGLTQSFLKNADYRAAADRWLARHHRRTVMCFVQFKKRELTVMPGVYLATPKEVTDQLCKAAGGRGDTILYEHHVWTAKAHGAGTTESIPDKWKFTRERVFELLQVR